MKPAINLITYASVLAKQETNAIIETHRELFNSLNECFEVNVIMHQDLKDNIPEGTNFIFIATGGTEGMVVNEYDSLPHPITLLTDGKANSLAASLELSNWVRNQGDECGIIHGSMNTIVDSIRKVVRNKLLKGCRIGVIGTPSDWLVASNVDYAEAKKKWGVEYVDIPLSLVDDYYAQTNDDEAKDIADSFVNNAADCIEPDKAEIVKAVRLYIAIKRVATEYKLDALTIQCFSLITTTCTTGCLALSLLNDEGIVAGCEGDLQSIFTMLLVKKATGKDSFMANPAFVDTENNEIILAHCTIGLHQTQKYIIRSHFESLSGVAIQGILPEDDVTIVKVGGKNLDRSVVLKGKIIENQNDERKCRTQIRIALDKQTSSVNYFLTNSIGNHHIVVQGNYADIIRKALNHGIIEDNNED